VLQLALTLALAATVTACGGVINPPPLPTRPPTPTRLALPTSPPTPTAEPERWVKNHRITDLWSGPLGSPGVVSFGKTSSTFCSFRVVGEADNARILVYNPYTDGEFWIDADAVGPVETPPHRAGPKPPGVNCTEAIYDGAPLFAPAALSTQTPIGTQTGTPSATVTGAPTGTTTPTATGAPVR
jgi:hypothetical protein